MRLGREQDRETTIERLTVPGDQGRNEVKAE